MSKENYDQIISEVYNRYYYHKDTFGPLTIVQFVEEIKTNNEFAERWGVKIEEKELSVVERMEYYAKHLMKEDESASFDELLQIDFHNTPKHVTSISYNNEKFEIYE